MNMLMCILFSVYTLISYFLLSCSHMKQIGQIFSWEQRTSVTIFKLSVYYSNYTSEFNHYFHSWQLPLDQDAV